MRDDAPTFTIYRMRFRTEDGTIRETVGVLGALEVVDEGAGGVLPHERTTPKAKTDRLDLTRADRGQPVAGVGPVADVRAHRTARSPRPTPVGTCTDADGVVHTVERVSDPDRVAAISAAVGANPVLIADGHHRYAISRTYRDERRAADGSGPWDLTLTYVGELVESQLSIDAIHRLYRGVDRRRARRRCSPTSFELLHRPAPIDAVVREPRSSTGAPCASCTPTARARG